MVYVCVLHACVCGCGCIFVCVLGMHVCVRSFKCVCVFYMHARRWDNISLVPEI